MSMIGKHHGRSRVHRVLAKSGYGKSATSKMAQGGPSKQFDDISSHLAAVERETRADGAASQKRLDKKPRK